MAVKGGGLRSRRGSDPPPPPGGGARLCRGLPGRGDCSAKGGHPGTILILGYTSPEEAPLLTRWHLTQTVADIDHRRALATRGRRVHVHLALDTGMHRLGILAEKPEGRSWRHSGFQTW